MSENATPAAENAAAEVPAEVVAAPAAEEAKAPQVEVDSNIVSLLEEGDKPVHSVDIKLLLEAGVHFGHQTKRWNPKMSRYIFGKRNDIHIIDLQKTLKGLKRAIAFLQETVKKGGRVLFVSTKRQAQEIVTRAAQRCDQYWVTERWLGGMMTNYETIQKRIKHLKHLQKMEDDGIIDALGKKEASKLRKQLGRLERYLGGIAVMKSIPEAMFVVDPRREAIAIKEARKLGIKIVAIVDTNCNPDEIDYVIPGNDDAIRAIKLITNYVGTCLSAVQKEKERIVRSDAEREAEEGEGSKKPSRKKAPAKKKAKAKAKPKADKPKAEAAKAEAPKAEKPKAEAKKADAEKADA